MKGDFSRIRFNPAKNFTAVLEQQGRVALDADANEQRAIEGYLRDTTNIDVIGPFGGPMGDAGFAIIARTDEILIEPGRYYVQGLLVESSNEVSYDEQPFLINPSYSGQQLLDAVQQGGGQVTANLTLEVWQRLVTWLDDPCLIEPRLGRPTPPLDCKLCGGWSALSPARRHRLRQRLRLVRGASRILKT